MSEQLKPEVSGNDVVDEIEAGDRRHAAREYVVRRACRIMGWDYHLSDVYEPPLALPALLDREIWSGDNILMFGERRIGRLIGYGACELDNAALLDLPAREKK